MEGLAATARNLEQTEQLLHKECKRTDADASELLASLALSLAVVRGTAQPPPPPPLRSLRHVANPKFAPTDAEHLSATVERYKTAVTRAITNNDVKRVVTQTRLVASIEATNFRLLSLVQPHAIAMGVPFAAHQTALAPERDAREWWTAHFATYPLQVPWELFLSAFSSYLSSLTPQQLLFTSDVTFLRYLLGTPLIPVVRSLAARRQQHGPCRPMEICRAHPPPRPPASAAGQAARARGCVRAHSDCTHHTASLSTLARVDLMGAFSQEMVPRVRLEQRGGEDARSGGARHVPPALLEGKGQRRGHRLQGELHRLQAHRDCHQRGCVPSPPPHHAPNARLHAA